MRESGAYALGIRSTPPAELSEYFTCQAWGLPHGKGWMEEPVNYTKKLSIAGNVFNIMTAFKRSKNWAAWMKANPDAATTFNVVMELLGQQHD